jgi:hypothetical protein
MNLINLLKPKQNLPHTAALQKFINIQKNFFLRPNEYLLALIERIIMGQSLNVKMKVIWRGACSAPSETVHWVPEPQVAHVVGAPCFNRSITFL